MRARGLSVDNGGVLCTLSRKSCGTCFNNVLFPELSRQGISPSVILRRNLVCGDAGSKTMYHHDGRIYYLKKRGAPNRIDADPSAKGIPSGSPLRSIQDDREFNELLSLTQTTSGLRDLRALRQAIATLFQTQSMYS